MNVFHHFLIGAGLMIIGLVIECLSEKYSKTEKQAFGGYLLGLVFLMVGAVILVISTTPTH